MPLIIQTPLLTCLLLLTLQLLIATSATSSLRLNTNIKSKTILNRRQTQTIKKTKSYTFMDASGTFPGMGHCVEGVLQAHLQARESNIRIAELPSFMNEYCEEDIAAALGTTSKAEGLTDSNDVWNSATAPTTTSTTTGATASTPSKNALVVTRTHKIVRVPTQDLHKMNMVRTMCTRLKELYEPKCCKERKPCCSGVWRARFASRPDALRYCLLVREAVEGRFASAMRLANDEMKTLDKSGTQLPSYRAQTFSNDNPDCLKGGKYEHDLRCGQLGDGSMLMTDGGRSLPSFALQADRTHVLRRAQDDLHEVQKEVDASKGRANDIRSLLVRTIRPSGVTMKLLFTSKQPLDTSDFAGSAAGANAITIAALERVVSASLYNVNDEVVTCGPTIKRICTREKPCQYGLSMYNNTNSHNQPNQQIQQKQEKILANAMPSKDNSTTTVATTALLEVVSLSSLDDADDELIDHSVDVTIRLSSANKASRVKKILLTDMYSQTLSAAFDHVMESYNITDCSVVHVKKTLGPPQSPPQWYVDQVREKVNYAEKEEKMMISCETMAKQMLVLTKTKADLDIDVALLIESEKPYAREKDHLERLALEIKIIGLNLTSCRTEGKLMYLKSGNVQKGEAAQQGVAVTPEMLELQHKLNEANVEIQTVVQQGRLRSSLGALSLKASRIGSQIEQETRIVKRAKLEAQLAELNMMRTQINAQLDRDQVHTKRINSIKKAILNDPSNIKLKQRLSNTLNEDKREREMLLNIAKTGDQCASCRTRVLSVMETAVQHGFEEKRLPEYMSSFCEVRLAITGPKYKLRNEIDINRVCTTLYQNLENDLKESLIEQAKAERLDGITMSNSGSNQRKEMRRLTPTASGHNATLHSYCMATSDCGLPMKEEVTEEVTEENVKETLKHSNLTVVTKHHTTHHTARAPQSKCDRCASNLMGNVNKWRSNSKNENNLIVENVFDINFQQWCHTRLDLTWTLRKDLINTTCQSAATLPPKEADAPIPSDNEFLFNPISWNELQNDNSRAHRDLIQLYSVCTSIGECHVEVEVDEGGASAPSATVRSAALSALDQIVLPTEEEQNKINKLIEDSEYLETEKLNLEKIFKRAEKMEYAAKDRESKAEETAEQQREASARCQIELVSATSKYVEMNDVVDRTCTSSTTAEKHMEKITRQLNEHKEQFKTILKSHTSASTECDQLHESSLMLYNKERKQERLILMKCVRDVNVQLTKWNNKEKEFISNPNYALSTSNDNNDAHPTIAIIKKNQNKLKNVLKKCEENEVLHSAEAKEKQEALDVECQARIGSLKQAEERVRSLELQTKKIQTISQSTYESTRKICIQSKNISKKRSKYVHRLTIQCSSAENLAERTKKQSANAAAAAAAIEVAKEIAKEQEEKLEGPSSSATGGDDNTESATGATGMQEESSAAADTYGGCALDVMAYERHVRNGDINKKKNNGMTNNVKRNNVWGLVSAWALSFCRAEAESAKSRALITGKEFHIDINTACGFASNIFMTLKSGSELETTIQFCKIIRQFTGKPNEGIKYNRQSNQHLLPKAPLSLRPEQSTSKFMYGPGPIIKTSERSAMEWYGNNEEMVRLRHTKYGKGNLDYLMAPQDADIAAREGQPIDMITNIESEFINKWKKKQISQGVQFVNSPKDIVEEPNRQLKVPIPTHRRVVVGETGGETGGESGASEDAATGGEAVR